MTSTIIYYFTAFLFFIACMISFQKWNKLPQRPKYRIGLIVLCTFLFSFIIFVGLVLFGFIHFDGAYFISLSMLFFFLFIVFTSFFITWYNDKYAKKVNVGNVIIVLCLSSFAIIFFKLRYMSNFEKEKLVQTISLNTVVTNITFDSHKPYFKDMTLADGQHLPMPETMNNTLQIGDSIFKNKGESIYTVLNNKTKIKKYFKVETHIRVLGKPQ